MLYTQVGFSLVLPCLLASRLLGDGPSVLDLLLSGLGTLLFTILGALAALYERGDGDHMMEMGKKMMEALTGTSTSLNQVGILQT